MTEITLRAPRPDDATAVLALLESRDIADLGAPDVTLEDVLEEWGATGLDLATDVRVAELPDGRIAGYAILGRVGVFVDVAPEHEGQGVGTRLLRWAEARERALARPKHVQWAAERNRRAEELLRGSGYECVRSYWRMFRGLAAPPAPVAPPDGIAVRAMDREGDGQTVHALDDLCFRLAPDYNPHTFEQFCEEHLDSHDVDLALSLVAERGEELVGYLITRRWDSERIGYVDVLGVHPAARCRGLAGALLGAAFGACAAAGFQRAELQVASDNPRALALYERAGMRARFRIDVFERPRSDL